jgi:hypothetical protein
MNEAIISLIAQVISTSLITLIGVLGAWLTTKIGQRVELSNINKAKDELIIAAQQTVMELQQTVVEKLKDKAADGKLTEEEITELGFLLVDKTKKKMSLSAIGVLEAASVDIVALIRGAGEALINQMHEEMEG